jgi:hypothetical protein
MLPVRAPVDAVCATHTALSGNMKNDRATLARTVFKVLIAFSSGVGAKTPMVLGGSVLSSGKWSVVSGQWFLFFVLWSLFFENYAQLTTDY